MNRSRFPILLAVLAVLLFGGCAAIDTLNRPVENSEAQAKVQQVEDALATLRDQVANLTSQLEQARAFIAEQDARLVEARRLAEESHSQAALAAVAAIERIRDQAQQGAATLQTALAAAADKVPQVEAIVAHVKDAAAKLPAGGTSPLWYVLGTCLLPVLIKCTQVATAGIPGVGPAVTALAETAITGLWNTMATSRLKAQDAETQARSEALDHQVQVAHELVQAAGDKADPILEAAKARQKAAGVHATLEPLVAAIEAKAA